MRVWNAHSVHGMTGDELASVVHSMLLDLAKAISILLAVSRARKGDYAPLDAEDPRGCRHRRPAAHVVDLVQRTLDRARCNGAVGHRVRQRHDGPGSARSEKACSSVPKRGEPRSLWTVAASSAVPVLALVGAAAPQDPSPASPT